MNLILALFPPQFFKDKKKPLEERLFVIYLKEKLTSKPKLYSSGSNSHTEFLVTHVVSEKKEVVQNEKEIKKIIASEVKREEDEFKKFGQSLTDIFDR